MGLTWDQISPFGARVDFDLAQALSPSDQDEFREIFFNEHLIVASGQNLSIDDQARITSYLGPLLEDQDGAEVVSNDPTLGVFGSDRLAFHSDLSFCPEPVLVGALYPLDVVNGATSTKFASGDRAYRRLPQSLRDRIEGLEVVHVFPVDQSRRNRLSELRPGDPRAVHPLVGHDARTHAPYLYLCEMMADRIVGLDSNESEDLIQTLFGYVYDPENIVDHRWAIGDLVLWDNLSVQHSRDDVSHVGPRTLRRTSAARVGFLTQCPQFAMDPDSGMAVQAPLGAAEATTK